MFTPYHDVEHAAQRRSELLREAKLRHLIRQAEADPAAMQDRWLNLIGDLMIAGGQRLKDRYTQAAVPSLHSPRHATALKEA